VERILLLLEHRENRRLLTELLSPNYEIALADTVEALDGAFDLAIVDGVSLDRYWQNIQARKAAEGTIFLPVLLIVSRQDVGMVTRHLWQTVDELILSPIEKIELAARVETLLRSRRYSLESERRYYTLAEHAPVGVYIVQNGELVYTNPVMARIIRESWYRGDGEPALVASKELEPDSAEVVKGSLTDWLVQHVDSVPYHLQVRNAEGERIFEVRTNPGEHQGKACTLGMVVETARHAL